MVDLEREEFVFLPDVQMTERDQKLLFDLGVQLKFGKRSALLQCLLKDFPHFVQDFAVETLFGRNDILDQLIVFGNCNDTEIKKSIIPTYAILLEKLNERLERLEDINYRNVCSSVTAAKRVKLTDKVYHRACYPSLDSSDYTKESFDMLKKEKVGKFYSFVPLTDALLKNIINLCTDNELIGEFAELWLCYCLPLLQKMKRLGSKVVKRMVMTYLNTLGRLIEHSPLDKLQSSEVILIAPIFKVSLELLGLFEYEEWMKEDLYIIRNFITQVNRGIYIYMFNEDELLSLLTIMEKAERKEVDLYKHINRVVGSIDSLRKLESYLEQGGLGTEISDYKRIHSMLLSSVEAIEYSKEPAIVRFFVDNHLKSILLLGKCAAYANKDEVHYEESKFLIERIMQLPSPSVKSALLQDILAKFNSSFSIKVGRAQDMYKNIVFELFKDESLRSRVLLNAINSSEVVKNLGYELLLTFYKKDYNNRKDAKFDISDFIPYILSDETVSSKARILLEEIKSIDSRILMNSIFTNLFSTSQNKRTLAYSSLFRHDLFDKCLRFSPKGDRSYNDRRLYQLFSESMPRVPFNDPLENIYDQTTGKITYLGKLNVFESSEKRMSKIGQNQIKELYDLLNIAVNEGLEFGVRISALEQINEVFFFYRNSIGLKEFAACALNFSLENIESYGRKRQAYRLEVFKKQKTVEDIDLNETYNFADELEVVVRFTAIFNNIMANYGFIDQIKVKNLVDIQKQNNGMFKFRTFWNLAIDPKLERKYQGLMALNLIYLNSLKIEKSLKSKIKFSKKRGLRTDARISNSYIVLFKNQEIDFEKFENAVRDFDDRILKTCKIDYFIATYLEQWRVITKRKEENERIQLESYQGRMLEIIKNKIIGGSFDLELEDLSSLMLSGDDSMASLKLLLRWNSNSKVSLLLDYSRFFSEEIANLFKKVLTDSLINFPNHGQLILAADTLTGLLESEPFCAKYRNDSDLKNFVKSICVYYSETVVSFIEELNLGHVKEYIPVINSLLGIITAVCALLERTKEQKIRNFISKKIFRKTFLKRLEDITRVIESTDAFSTTMIRFVSQTIEMFEDGDIEEHYVSILTYLFDSLLITKNDDNFLGVHQIKLLLKLAHKLIVKNRFRMANIMSIGDKRRIEEEMSSRKNYSLKTKILKSTTIGWIVRLTTCRSTEVRMLSWNVLTGYIDDETLEMFPSLVDAAIQIVNSVVAAVGEKVLVFAFLTKVAGILRRFGSIGRCDGVNNGVMNVKYFLRIVIDRGKLFI